PEDLAEAFQNHGYPWSADGDPFKDRYRRWVPDLPELPPSAHALLKVRERALKEKNKKDIAELREELAKIGYIVRDEGVNQYGRPVDKPPVSKKYIGPRNAARGRELPIQRLIRFGCKRESLQPPRSPTRFPSTISSFKRLFLDTVIKGPED